VGPSYKVVVGYARVTASAPASKVHDQFVLAMKVDPETHRVLATDCTAVTGVARQFVSDLLVGFDLARPVEEVLAVVDSSYLGFASGSIKQAIIDASRRYRAPEHRHDGHRPSALGGVAI
jgi:hypothetical protein